MKIKRGFSLAKSGGLNTIICLDNLNQSFNSTITLNETNAFLFEQLLLGEKSRDQLFELVKDNFSVSSATALRDIDTFIKILLKNGIIEK